jgi:hypothetical protein
VPADLTHDRRHRERDEFRAVLGIETVDGVHQTEAGDLHEVIMIFAAAAESAGDVLGEWQTPRDHLVAEPFALGGSGFTRTQLLDRAHNIGVIV